MPCKPPPPDAHRRPRPQRPSRRRQRRSPPSPRYPSPNLLSILASIAASSTTVDGSPTPPGVPPLFLCPSLDDHPVPLDTPDAVSPILCSSDIDTPSRVTGQSNAVASAPFPISQMQLAPNTRLIQLSRRAVPDRYERGDDGSWRKIEEYTLYGSTICTSCKGPTSVVQADDQIQPPFVSQPTSTSVPRPSPDISDTLPPGWKQEMVEKRTSLILSLSLVLAFAICFFIVTCIFWRRANLKKKPLDVDLEMKLRKKRRRQSPSASTAEDRDPMLQKGVQLNQKLWARATARWKANARYTARQRRGKRGAINRSSQTPNLSITPSHPPREATPVPSTPVVAPLERLSTPDQDQGVECDHASQSSARVEEEAQQASSPPDPDHIVPALPPAYQQSGLLRPTSVAQHGPDFDAARMTAPLPDLSSSSTNPSTPSHDDNDGDQYLYPRVPHAAHLATDDKTVLAQMVDLASAPPDEGYSMTENDSGVSGVSAPAWQDDEDGSRSNISQGGSRHLDGVDTVYNIHRNVDATPAREFMDVFPPPPSSSKGKMASTFYKYRYSYDDISSFEPELGPSAPPFEAEAAELPTIGAPSAPPIFLDPPEGNASVPCWDEDSLNDLYIDGSDQHLEPTRPTSSHPSSSHISTQPQWLPVQGPVDRDGRPPIYEP
ncbi:hypothetical protein AX17_000536 [Amanita inopinata Kibby_2008]|nr:hypothetical protein AX17_000536 [Amanita inopinata Kibby_2008]